MGALLSASCTFAQRAGQNLQSVDDPSPVENFKFRPEEAIVLIGPAHPPVKYFGRCQQ
jgi:hypothetical protein